MVTEKELWEKREKVLKELEEQRKKNFEEKLNFVRFYAEWVKKTPVEIWSAQQAKLINSVLKSSKKRLLTKKKE